jgi:hypothetical protein
MKGARAYYDIITNAVRRNLGNLKQVGDGYLNGNVLYVTSSHARGTQFFICLVDNTEEISQDNCFKVYGIISGNPGWTECYGWIHNGNWNEPILNYLENLKNEIKLYDENIEEQKRLKEEEHNKAINETIDKFNKLF